MGRSRTHKSKYKGASRHGGGKLASADRNQGTQQQPKKYGRYVRYPNGTVPQSNRTPEEQLKHLDKMKFRAVKERNKLKRKMEEKIVSL